jgi:hypothetical protein
MQTGWQRAYANRMNTIDSKLGMPLQHTQSWQAIIINS